MPRQSASLSLLPLLLSTACAMATGEQQDAAPPLESPDATPPSDPPDAGRPLPDAGVDAPPAADAAPPDAATATACELDGELPDATGELALHHYSGSAGSRDYWLYVPSDYDGSPRPLVVLFHGCTQTAEALSEATGYDRVAEACGALVAYPDQSLTANSAGCWNWFAPAHQERGTGEPAIVAAIVDDIAAERAVDPARTYVGGFSAGASMALVMAATYPDRFAAVTSVAGCPYGGGCYGLESAGTMADGLLAAMGEYARPVPILVANGSADPIVQPAADQVARDQFLGLADRLDDGLANQSVAVEPASVEPGSAGGLAYRRSRFDDADARPLAEHWEIDGLGHSWCGNPSDQPYASAQGPDLSRESFRFFLAHPMP